MLRLLVPALVVALGGACVDFYYEWPNRVPGGPPSTLYTFREEVGLRHGWLLRGSDDVFSYDDLEAGFRFEWHSPVFREPAGQGGWMDFYVIGVAPWFLAALWLVAAGGWRAWRKRAATQVTK